MHIFPKLFFFLQNTATLNRVIQLLECAMHTKSIKAQGQYKTYYYYRAAHTINRQVLHNTDYIILLVLCARAGKYPKSAENYTAITICDRMNGSKFVESFTYK